MQKLYKDDAWMVYIVQRDGTKLCGERTLQLQVISLLDIPEVTEDMLKQEGTMINHFLKWNKRISSVVITCIVIIICTACAKGEEEWKLMTSALEAGYINSYWNNGIQTSNTQISNDLAVLREQQGDLEKDNTETVKTDDESTEDNTVASQTDEESADDKWDVDFNIVRTVYLYNEQRSEIDIYYPQLSGFADSAKEERINALIEEDVKKIIRDEKGDEYKVYCVSLDYEIKFLNKRIISILYDGMDGYITPGHGLNGKALATTIDMEEERVIALKDVVTDYTELGDMLLADEFEHITKWEGKAGGYTVSWEYRGCEDNIEDDLRERYNQWYTDGDNFVIITEKRADYNEYSINIESVRRILDAEFLKKLE